MSPKDDGASNGCDISRPEELVATVVLRGADFARGCCMHVERWLMLIALGGLAGMLGQVGRIIVGLKKLSSEAEASGKSCSDLIEPSRLVVSLVIGFTAGAFAAILAKDVNDPDVTLQQILAFAGAGYAGADFIEGAMSGVSPSTAPASAAQAAATADGYVG